MRLPYLLFFLSFGAFAQTSPQIKVLPQPKTIEDYEHQYKGCPENSECDQVMGLQMGRWKNLISKVKDPKIVPQDKMKYLEAFRAKYGIPVEFYTNQSSQLGFKPLLFDSHCKDHNPKEGKKFIKGTSFVKSISKDWAVVWRDQTQIEVPLGEILIPQPVVVYEGGLSATYQLPLGDQPLFIKNKELYVLREEDDFFYTVRISPDGDWKIDYLDMANLAQYEEKRMEVACPKSTETAPKVFGVQFCKTISNEDTKSFSVVKLYQGCPN